LQLPLNTELRNLQAHSMQDGYLHFSLKKKLIKYKIQVGLVLEANYAIKPPLFLYGNFPL
jgi:hypothetical protein